MILDSNIAKTFLVIRLSSLGDVLLTTPALRCLRETFPDAIVDVLVKDRYLELLQGNPNVSSLRLFSDSGKWKDVRPTCAALRNHYDVVVDLHTGLRSFHIRHQLGTKRVLAYKKRRLARWLLVKFKRNFYDGEFSVPLAYLEALAPLGVKDDGEGLEWPAALSARSGFLERVSIPGIPDPKPIAICPGASYATKRWPLEHWTQLSEKLLERGYSLWVFGDKSDDETGDALRRIAPAKVANFCGRLGLAGAGAGLSYCKLAVTHDAGPAHMATAVGLPVVAIFGSTVTQFGFRPFRIAHRIAQIELPCRPCSHLGYSSCPLGHFRCMRDLSVKHVLELVDDLDREIP